MSDPFGQHASKVTIKGGRTSKEQRQILARALAYADKVKAPYKAKIALLTALIQESEAKNLSTPSADGYGSYGVLQGLERYHSRKNLMNPEYQFSVFLGTNKKWKKGFTSKGNAIDFAKTGMSVGQIAQAVEGSAYPDRYQTSAKEAAKILRLYRAGSGSATGVKPVSGGKPATGGVMAPASAAQTQSALLSLIANRQGSNQPVAPVDPGFSRA
jgi:hypothetical protein